MSRALISVSDKTDVVSFAKGLLDRGFDIVSTGGTARALAEAGVPVTSMSSLTGFPELMDGRVKTLHPAVHAGILARRGRPDDLAALAEHRITPIDLVCVNLYPFVKAARRSDTNVGELIEEIDIGGPTLIRAAAKNFTDVAVVVDPADYRDVLKGLAEPAGIPLALRLTLARKAFAHTAAYDTAISSAFRGIHWSADGLERTTGDVDRLPDCLDIRAAKARDLRYGENPHQPAAWYPHEPPAGLGGGTIVQGKELSFTNLLDLDAAARLAAEFDGPAAVVVKHTNPCGVATGQTIAEAYLRAREADPLSAFGGIAGLNRPLDEETARLLTATFMEAVVAPGVADGARPLLAARGNMRVLDLGTQARVRDAARLEIRTILGGYLAQERDEVAEAHEAWPADHLRVATRRAPSPEEWEALRFAWRVAAHVKSNAVVFTAADRTVAIGAGQMSRVDAVKVAIMKAAGPLAGCVAASDAFFPFRDGIDQIAETGATAVVQPGGSVRDAEVIAAADEHGLAMVFTGRRHFRH
jgi:phosphoribosylaminoimidazolecarboxamide formyltransferase/IMP cyclohydrolase